MSSSDSFDDVLARLQQGDEDAAAEVFHRFAGRLIRLAHRRLDAQIRRKVDAEDVMQSVFRSFFCRQAEGQFELQDWDSLWALLVRITLRKCGRRVAALRRQRRDVGREVAGAISADESQEFQAIAREPTPDEAASLAETLATVMRGLDARQQQILVFRLQGYTVEEISREVGRSERTVERILSRIRESLKQWEEATAG